MTTTEDRLVTTLTAFSSWQDMLSCLRRGYVPTISHTKAGHKLAKIVESHGFRVFMPRSGNPNRK